MNNSYKHNANEYTNDTDTMMSLIERDHGGCDDEDCSMRQLFDDPNSSVEEIIHWWAYSGAADEHFNDLYTKHEQAIIDYLKDGAK